PRARRATFRRGSARAQLLTSVKPAGAEGQGDERDGAGASRKSQSREPHRDQLFRPQQTQADRARARSGGVAVRIRLLALPVTLVLLAGASALSAAADRVPELDHVFVIVLENHNSFTSFGAIGILDNPMAPKITALAHTYNFASNYHGVWHPSLPNYVA